jgi:large subunit ribosomal protein L25
MQMIQLQASARPTAGKANALRRSGKVPGVLYGNVDGTLLVSCEETALLRAYNKAGESTLVELDMEGKKVPVLFHALDLDPVTDRPAHVDFYAVDMKKEIEASVPVRLEGEAPAVKDLGAILVTPLDHVRVRCLPGNLPQFLTISISGLKAFHDTVTVASIPLPAGVAVLDAAGTVVVLAQEPRKEEEVAPPPAAEGAAAEGAAAEGATAEGAEGAAPEGGKAPAAAAGKEKKEEKKEEKK